MRIFALTASREDSDSHRARSEERASHARGRGRLLRGAEEQDSKKSHSKKILILHEHRNDAGSPRVPDLAPVSSSATTAPRPRAPASARIQLPKAEPLTSTYRRDASATVPGRALHARMLTRCVRLRDSATSRPLHRPQQYVCFTDVMTHCHRLAPGARYTASKRNSC